MVTVLQDFRFAFRMLARNPGFTAIAVLTLAVGVAATTSVFSVLDGVLLRPLPYADPYRTVWVYRTHKRAGFHQKWTSIATYWDWKDRNGVFDDLALMQSFGANFVAGDRAERVTGALVTDGFFSVLGVKPFLGAVFAPGESAPDPNFAVISYGLWRRCFGGGPDVLGEQIVLDGHRYTVVGVMPPGFSLPDQAEVWRPLTVERTNDQRDWNNYSVIARLKPEVTLEQAQANMHNVSRAIGRDYPAMASWSTDLISLQEEAVSAMRTPLLVLLGAVGLVLVITCVNVANLLLVRNAVRREEVAIRAALGAGRWRLVRQFLIESLTLSFLGGCVGVMLTFWGIDLLLAWSPANLSRLDEVHMNGHVLGFALLLLPFVAILFGSLPALRASKCELNETLKDVGRCFTRSGGRIRAGLVVSEIALSLMLLIGASLLLKTLYRLRVLDPGFDVERVLTMRVALPEVHYPEDHDADDFFRELQERIETLPGVLSAGFTTAIPISDWTPNMGVQRDSAPIVAGSTTSSNAQFQWVSRDYHRVVGQQLEKGRLFDEGDHTESPPVAIINKRMAREFWGGEDPIGKSFRFIGSSVRIVGVVSDVKRFGLDKDAPREVYVPLAQVPGERVRSIVVRSAVDPTLIADDLRSVIAALDPRLPVYNLQAMAAVVSDSVSGTRFVTLLLSSFAGAATLLAALGVYSVVAYSVRQKRGEIGLRMALGAQRRDVLRFVLKQGLTLTAVGLSIGFVLSLAGSRVLSSLLFEVSAFDPVTFVGVPLVLGVVTLTACYIPARRATKVDPMVALRCE